MADVATSWVRHVELTSALGRPDLPLGFFPKGSRMRALHPSILPSLISLTQHHAAIHTGLQIGYSLRAPSVQPLGSGIDLALNNSKMEFLWVALQVRSRTQISSALLPTNEGALVAMTASSFDCCSIGSGSPPRRDWRDG